MPRSSVFAALVASSNLAADDTLVAALNDAAPDEAGPIVEAILDRKRPEGLFGLVAAHHRLDALQQRRVVDAIDDLYGTLRDACSQDPLQTRLNAIAIINNAACGRLGYLLNTLLRDPSARVREAAALALRSIADRFLTATEHLLREWRPAELDDRRLVGLQHELAQWAEERRRLNEALAGGIECFEAHHHPPVLEAAMWFVDDLKDKLWRPLKTPGSHARRAAMDILQRTPSARLVPFAIEALVYNDFRPHAMRMLTEKATGEVLAAVANQSWRMAADPIRKAMAHVKHWPRLAATFGQPGSWAESCQPRGVRMIGHSALPADIKLDLLRLSLFGTDSAGRRAALWAVCDVATPVATTLLDAIARQGDEQLARIARRELRRRTANKDAERASASLPVPQPCGEPDGVPRTPELERLWAAFDSLTPAEKAVESTAVLAVTDYLSEFVETRLGSPDSDSRTRALRILTLSGRAADVAERVYTLAHDTAPVVRSAALSALGQVPTPASERILRAAMNDADGRVRANAVESLDRLTAGTAPQIYERLHDPDNRARANATKALVKLGIREAAEILCAMLRDPNARQRISALWVVERLQLAPLLNRVVELAETDPDLQVRDRARHTLGRVVHRAPSGSETIDTEGLPSSAS
jgi:HEAT repeat protein